MTEQQVFDELNSWKKQNLCYLIVRLMRNNIVDIIDINECYVRTLEDKLAEKDKIIHEADNCIFESVFTDSLGKPADNAALMRKLEWLDKVGTHNMDGIYKHLKEE